MLIYWSPLALLITNMNPSSEKTKFVEWVIEERNGGEKSEELEKHFNFIGLSEKKEKVHRSSTLISHRVPIFYLRFPILMSLELYVELVKSSIY